MTVSEIGTETAIAATQAIHLDDPAGLVNSPKSVVSRKGVVSPGMNDGACQAKTPKGRPGLKAIKAERQPFVKFHWAHHAPLSL